MEKCLRFENYPNTIQQEKHTKVASFPPIVSSVISVFILDMWMPSQQLVPPETSPYCEGV